MQDCPVDHWKCLENIEWGGGMSATLKCEGIVTHAPWSLQTDTAGDNHVLTGGLGGDLWMGRKTQNWANVENTRVQLIANHLGFSVFRARHVFRAFSEAPEVEHTIGCFPGFKKIRSTDRVETKNIYIHEVPDNDDKNLLYEGDSFCSASEVSVGSEDSSIPVTMLDEDDLVDFCE